MTKQEQIAVLRMEIVRLSNTGQWKPVELLNARIKLLELSALPIEKEVGQ